MTEILTETLHIRRLEVKAEETARACGMLAIRDDDGGFVLVDLLSRRTVASGLSPLDVLRLCRETKISI